MKPAIMKPIVLSLLISLPLFTMAQKAIPVSDSIQVTIAQQPPYYITIPLIQQQQQHTIGAVGIPFFFPGTELFNSATGRHTYLLTEKNGKSVKDMYDHIALLCTSDSCTGRRFVKGIKDIRIQNVLP